jgi:hypothetical protein
MRSMFVVGGYSAWVLAAFLGAGSIAGAETQTYKAALSAQKEVPVNSSKGTGNAEVTYDTNTKMLTWTITFDGLTGPATVAHFHGPAEEGKNAGVALLIGNTPTSPAKGTATLNDMQAADLMGGRWYVNVHTMENRGGEIRGQLMK